MKKYIAVIRRDLFAVLHKMGYTTAVKECEEYTELNKDKNELFDELFNEEHFTYDGHSENYVVLTWEAQSKKKNIEIKNCDGVFALDLSAKKKIVFSTDKRIKINDPIWKEEFDKFKQEHAENEILRGVENVIIVFVKKDYKCKNLKEVYKFVSKYMNLESLIPMFIEARKQERLQGDFDKWIYGVHYKRHAAYHKKCMEGFVMDAFNSYKNYRRKCEDMSNTCTDDEISKIDSNFNEQLERHEDKEYVKVISWFYMLREMYNDGIDIEKKYKLGNDEEWSFDRIKKEASEKDEIKKALLLLGMCFGYDKTRNALYSVNGVYKIDSKTQANDNAYNSANDVPKGTQYEINL